MMAHKDDIYSRPKRTWFATEREKKLLAKAAKVSLSLILSSVMHFIRMRCFACANFICFSCILLFLSFLCIYFALTVKYLLNFFIFNCIISTLVLHYMAFYIHNARSNSDIKPSNY